MKFKDLSQNTVASFFFTLTMLLVVVFNNGIPSYDELREISGTLEWFETKGNNKDTFRFKLKEHEEKFVYHSVSGSLGAVNSALNKKNAELKILYDPHDSDTALWEFETIHPVYQVVSDNHLVKSYRSTAARYNSNDNLAIWLLISGFIASVVFIAIDWNIKQDAN
ncbi:hypothetical protein AAEU32_11685 [Pseudoalteromonas sp. SSDWG2]|uniref:hypothetical protein n=1 Tax=Pseudoalteromonas sp. SSDWG2 TaxID=3139391 RepID=UPI003BA95FE4